MPELNNIKMQFEYPIFPDSTVPEGFLPRDKAAQACWYLYILCQKQCELVGTGPESQIIVEDIHDKSATPWHDHHYLATARTVELIYQTPLETIYRYWPAVIQEAERMGLPAPRAEYMSPRRFMI